MCPRPARGETVFGFTHPGKQFDRMALGIAYIEFDVPKHSAKGIAQFYQEIISAPSETRNFQGMVAEVQVGEGQKLIFREMDRKIPAFDGHHIQIYIANFSTPMKSLMQGV